MREQFKVDIEGITFNSDTINLHLQGYIYSIFEYDNGSLMVKVFRENGAFVKSVEIDATLDELLVK